MLSFLTDTEHNDLYLDTRGNLAVGEAQLAVGQVCKNVLRTSLGELPLNITAGIPYMEDIFVSNASLGMAQAYMIQAIKNVANVVRILDFRLTRTGDVLNFTAKILTREGVTEING